jgi:hypothetical protein
MPSLGRGKTSVQVSFDGVTYISGPEFQVIEKVTLDGITPSRGPIQGSNLVTLNGAGFEQSDAYFCVFGFHPNMTNGRVVSSSSILCTAPKQSGPVRVHVSLQAHGRITVDVPMAYEFSAPALATSLEPAAGRVLGGTAITVRGQGFTTSGGAGVKCLFGNVTSLANVSTDNQAVCLSPRGNLGAVRFCMISVEDDVNCGGSLVFEYVEDARVASIVPTQGSMEGGTSVSVVGTGFRGKVSCRVGMRECRGAQRVSSTLLTCVTAGQREAGDVMVEVSNNGAEYFGGDVRFRYTEQWKIVSAYPSRGPDAGNTVVTVIGEGFPSESSFSCRFGKAAASKGQRMSASMVKCRSPVRNTSDTLSVSLSDNWGDYKHGSALFRYEATLQAKSVMPSSGFVDGGTEVTVLGLGFDAGMQLLCRFGQRDEEARMVSSTSVACMAPAQPAGVLRLGLLDDRSGAS